MLWRWWVKVRIRCPEKSPRPIADLEWAQTLPPVESPDYAMAIAGAETAPLLSRHIAEAIGYRNLDRSDYGTTL